ncbi:hypothetical protein [Methanogenium cariaci]|uniref:hypothetical protein n=1 Tax=Methanogenium cariaci TaxID=2197 RepID=UPI001C4498B4|nr:hypothetical protein [Methanogenium cariaci]
MPSSLRWASSRWGGYHRCRGGTGGAPPLQTGIVLLLPEVIIVTGLWVGILAVIFDGCAGIIEKRLSVRYGEW